CFSFFLSSRRRHTISNRDWSSDVCSSDLIYPELEIVDAYSIYEIDETLLKHEGVDYIISTVPFEHASIPILNVSPFLDKNDRQQINTIINKSREQYVYDIKGLGPTLKEVLPKNRILTQQPSLCRNDSIRQS